MISPRNRYIFFTSIALILVTLTSFFLRDGLNNTTPFIETIQDFHGDHVASNPAPTYPRYKLEGPSKALLIVDNFPLAWDALSPSDLPPVPSWNRPPSEHVPENTPLFIGFTRSWRLLQQVVVSYITAGWPPSDIYVVENTGVMNSNALGRLSLQNPFFLNHTRLHLFGVNILRTPTLLTFAQLQNFYLHTSIEKEWEVYFWSHMDVVALAFEDRYAEAHPDSLDAKDNYKDFKSIYMYCVDALREVTAPEPNTKKVSRWAQRFFSYDRLALVNVSAFVEVGGWDTLIPFYMTDCDMHARIEMAGMGIEEKPAGLVFDVGSSLDNLIVLYRKRGTGVRASFKDPNIIEEELEKLATGEKKTAEEGEEVVGTGEEVIAPKREERVENGHAKHMAEKAWEKFSLGPSSASATPKTTIVWTDDDIHSEDCITLIRTLDQMEHSKQAGKRGRNTWQARQTGGQGEPFYRDSAGFDQGIQLTIDHGRRVFSEKWGHRDCDIAAIGLRPEDAWRVEHDW